MSGTPSTRALVKVFVTFAALAFALYFLYLIRSVIGLMAIAIFLALALAPPVAFFVRRGVPRAASILLVYALIAASIFGIGLLVVPPAVNQVDALAQDAPQYLADLRSNETFRRFDDKYEITTKLQDQAEKLPSRLGDAAGALQSVTVGVFGAVTQLITVLALTFSLLLDGRRITDFLFSLMGRPHEARWRAVADDVHRAVSGYVSGNLLISLVAGITTYVTLLALGVPFAVPLAVLMAFLDLIPLVGATIAGILIGVVAAFHDFPTALIVWAVVFLLYQQFENHVLQPAVYRRALDVHPIIVVLAILIGASQLGVLGALLAIPAAAAAQIVVRDVWAYRRGALPAGEPAEAQTGS
jgi:predicted PurR-regulated permease PerM